MNVTWLPPPPRPEISPGEIHVWFCDFSGVGDFGAGHSLLAEAEIRRAASFRFEDARLTYVGAHIFLRRVLGAYLQLSADRVAFTAEAGGKPRLDRSVHSTDLQFNLSHSHRSATCAVATMEVGIDMEYPNPKLCEPATAEPVFSTQELLRLRELEPEEKVPAFFRCWTKKEAYAKCKGVGLADHLKLVEFGLDGGRSGFEKVSLVTFECPGNFIASMAVEGPLRNPQFWKIEAKA